MHGIIIKPFYKYHEANKSLLIIRGIFYSSCQINVSIFQFIIGCGKMTHLEADHVEAVNLEADHLISFIGVNLANLNFAFPSKCQVLIPGKLKRIMLHYYPRPLLSHVFAYFVI